MTIVGAPGMGKTTIVSAAAGRAGKAADIPACNFAIVHCLAAINAENPYEPFLELLSKLQVPESRRRRLFRIGVNVASESAPDLLGQVPAVGPFLKLGANAAKAAAESGAWRSHPDALAVAPSPMHIGRSVSSMLWQLASRQLPLIVIIEDAHRIDPSSCIVLETLLNIITSQRMGVCLTYRPESVRDDHPLRSILVKAELAGFLQKLSISGFERKDVEEFALFNDNIRLSINQSEQLWQLTGGHPIFVSQYLALLRERGALRSEDAVRGRSFRASEFSDWPTGTPSWHFSTGALPVPHTVQLVIRERFQEIDVQTRTLLMIASVQGERFMSKVVHKVADLPHEEVLERLQDVSRSSGLIIAIEPADWVRSTGSDTYRFDHAITQQTFYHDQSPQLLRERHRAVARALEDIIEGLADPPREALIDIARHLHLAGEALEAAQRTHEVAVTLALEGSMVEAAALCVRALNDVRLAASTEDTARLHAEIIELLLATSELQWRGRTDLQGELPLEDLAMEASEAASLSGILSLQARIGLLRGRVAHKAGTVDEALAALSEAKDLAEASGDIVSIFLTSAEYAHVLTKKALGQGLDGLRDAEDLYLSTPQLRDSTNPVVIQGQIRVEQQLGINSFDAGDLGEAQRRLDACLARLRGLHITDELPTTLNYMGQVHLALGALDRAERALREALDLSDGSTGPNGWHGYNLALLAKVKAERGQLREAKNLAEEGWAETEATWLVDLVPLVCNIRAEILLENARADPADLIRAETVLQTSLEESRRSRSPRGELAALSLLGLLKMFSGDIHEAVAVCRAAMQMLSDIGPMPAIRTEEIIYRCAIVFEAANDRGQAIDLLRRAIGEVDRKAESIHSIDDQRRFYENVSWNRAIRTSLRRLQ